jgi:hypothetical protein
MAVAVDQASLGTAAANATSATITTTNAVAALAHVIVLLGMWRTDPPPANTVTVAGNAATQAHTIVSGALRLGLFYYYAAAGLASSSAIVGTGQAGSNGILMCAASYTGIDTTGTVTGFNATAAATAAYSSGNVSASAGDALIGGCWGDGAQRTSTPTGPAVERSDFNTATTGQSVTLVDKLSMSATDALAGTWSGTLDHMAIAVAFKPAAGAAVVIPSLVMAPHTPA